jgi:hypothetical protein
MDQENYIRELPVMTTPYPNVRFMRKKICDVKIKLFFPYNYGMYYNNPVMPSSEHIKFKLGPELPKIY